MARRRFGPLLVAVVLATCALIVRLGQVQLEQHTVWADEAAALVRVGRVVPYRRGDIRDASGEVLVSDRASYQVAFVYRSFRREHPLGQVAHALSTLELRCVPLAEARERLDPLALALVRLKPDDLAHFRRGGALDAGPLRAPALDRDASSRAERVSRASDLSFYILALLDLERRESQELAKWLRASETARACSYVELAARLRSADRERQPPPEALARVEAELQQRLARSREDLFDLAEQLAAAGPALPAGTSAVAHLLARLEGWRAEVEDGVAGELFSEAAEFSAGRVEPVVLQEHLDLRWLAAILRWDEARTAQWLTQERRAWLERMGLAGPQARSAAIVLDSLLVEVELAPIRDERASLVLAAWTAPYLARRERDQQHSLRSWLAGEELARVRPLAVLVELDDLFAQRLPREARPSRREAFAFQDREQLERGARDDCEVLARAELWPAQLDAQQVAGRAAEVDERSAFWRAWRADFERDQLRKLRATLEAQTVLRWTEWEREFQELLAAEFTRLRAQLAPQAGALGEARPLELAAGRLDRAGERARYTLRDYGARSALVVSAPSYSLVHLLTRRPESFAGFRVERTHERVRHGGDAQAVEERALFVPSLLGDVRTPRLRDVYNQRKMRSDMAALRRLSQRTQAEQRELESLVARVRRSDEQHGSDGIEGYFDPELKGRNGYVEERGLEQALDRARPRTDLAPSDGKPLTLSVESSLQRAALEVFDRPERDPTSERIDPVWLARPTGALVLMEVTGELLALASYPDQPRDGGLHPRDRELERTLRLYKFQPPGSVMKPFSAAWALDRLHLDPGSSVDCVYGNLPDGRPGYGSVHCNVAAGHGHGVDVHEALRRSCNSYFAWLGHTHYRPQDFLDMYAAFGFGQPTGVRNFGERYGLREDGFRSGTQPSPASFTGEGSIQLACNGLGIPQTTVVQVARAYAGLATGRLPQVRLVRAIGDQRLDPEWTDLPLRPESLEFVRRSLMDCANTRGGSAEPALARRELGFSMAAKTGSADLARTDFTEGSRVSKHTWVAGWFPAEAPRYVLVVFCDTTTATSSHSAIWLARQYLQSPAVHAYLRAAGVLP